LFCDAESAPARAALTHWHEQRVVKLIWLGRRGCEAAAAQLVASTLLVPPAGRRLGVFEVGYLPVAPTWD